MALLISSRGESPPRVPFYSDSKFTSTVKPPDQPETFIYSVGNMGLLTHRKLPTPAPMWRYCDVTYMSSDDEEENIHEGAIELFVKRVILASTMNQEGEETFGIDDPSDGSLEDMDYDNRPHHQLPTLDKQEWKKKMRKSRKNSDGKKEKMPVPELIGPYGLHLPLGTTKSYSLDGRQYVQMPLEIYRDTVLSEVDSISRRIYHHFSDELKHFDNVRVNALKDSFFWHGKTKVLERLLEVKESEIKLLKEEKRELYLQIENEKKLKRQRRADKKRRKAEKPLVSSSDTLDPISLTGGLETKCLNAAKKP